MKKAITILAVLIVLVSAVFADEPTQKVETHTIKLHSTVGGVVPVFHLVENSITAVKADNTDLSDDTVRATNASNVKFTDGASRVLDPDTAVEVGDITKANIVVSFDVTVSNAAKIYKDYTLAFSATGFDVNKNGQRKTTAAPGEEYTANAQLVLADGVTMNGKVAKFNGTTCSENGTKLATYVLTYAKDPTVDPTSDLNDATYQSTVSMTISTT